ncbi:MAG: glucose-6-phosphate isomerase [Pseudomonadota bacterium]|nr:glucose-6-phosphate isomerase [Pseudomonadota bacterium]
MSSQAIPPLPSTPHWQALAQHWQAISPLRIRDLFREDPGRFTRFSIEAGPLFLDYSKNRITADTLPLLTALARAAGVPEAIERMFRGERISSTEQRAALHTALRNRSDTPVYMDGEDVMPGVRAVLAKMRSFSEAVHAGEYRGHGGSSITDIVNIGIGGSHLGPLMATRGLRPYRKGDMHVHFVSNIDPADLGEVLEQIDPGSTLFIIASKTFTTLETLTNAEAAKRWFFDRIGDPAAVGRHFLAVSTNLEATRRFGIDDDRVFQFWDWAGGRFSLWSAIGLPIALCVGMDRFEQLLEGAHRMDRHFRTAPLERNLPAVLALLSIWYTNFFGAQTHAVVPYDQHLEFLPAYLQQLAMESNGKRVTAGGQVIDYATAPVLWGAPGTNGQHAFFQLLHQGTVFVPVDFMTPLQGYYRIGRQHELLFANCVAQSEALMRGKGEDEVRAELATAGLPSPTVESLLPHKVFPGNKPSNTLVYERLTPETLGALIAAYEHKTFVEGVIWGINSFDQWGVELGKQLATRVASELEAQAIGTDHDGSTRGLMHRYIRARHGDPVPD